MKKFNKYKKILLFVYITMLATFAQAQNISLPTYLTDSTAPAGATLEYHNALPISSSNLVPNPNTVAVGTYYIVYNYGGNCYSDPTQIRVLQPTCPSSTIDISSYIDSTNKPSGMVVTLHTALPVSNANRILNFTQPAGNYYVAYNDIALGCYTNPILYIVKSINCSVVPIHLVSFNGLGNGCSAMLNWATGTESNFNHFELEMSKDGVNFNKIATILGSNSVNGSSYVYQYLQNTNKAYYRLKQVDNDNRYEYSKTILLVTSCNKASITIAPNPVQKELSITSSDAIKMIRIFKADGRLMLIKGNYSSGQLLNVSNFANGTYLIEIETVNGNSEKLKFIKE